MPMNKNNYSLIKSIDDVATIHEAVLVTVEKYMDYNDDEFDSIYDSILDVIGVQEEMI